MIGAIAKNNFLNTLKSLHTGCLELLPPDGQVRIFGGKKGDMKARLVIHDWRVISNLARYGDHGFIEDYKAGRWETDDLGALLTLALANDNAVKKFIFGSQFFQKLSALSYYLRLNTLKGSKRNIHAHYDLGNAFYKLWLDPSMTYSSALYKEHGESLAQAQYNKYDRIISRLERDRGHLLEIGCGWGGFAERVQEHGDFAVKGITLSEEQHKYAKDRLGPKAEIVLEDYRHQRGKFDSIVSIEMFEAVGERYWPAYFGKLADSLKQRGKAVIQTITIDEKHFDRYRRGGDFIRSFIFPGGMLPSPARFRDEAARAGLRVENEFYFGQDYARTLEQWLHNFDQERENIKALGFDDGFIRLWRFYLAGCIAGFKTGRTNVMQAELSHA